MRPPRTWQPSVLARGLTLLALAATISGCLSTAPRATSSAAQTDAQAPAAQAKARLDQLRAEVVKLKAERAAAGARAASRTVAAPSTASASAHGGTILPAAVRASFARLAASLPGRVGLAVSPVGLRQHVEQLGSLRSAVAWSTSKVPVAMAAIDAGVADAPDLTRAIEASDNAAATNLWNALGGGAAAAAAANAQLRAAGDHHTRIQSRTLRPGFTPFGQTSWALADQVRFTAGMACSTAGGQVLGLMNNVIPSERWGLGAAGVEAQLKGGWGPGSTAGVGGGYLDRQMGVLTIAGKPLAVAIAIAPSDGSHDTGTRDLTTLARWVVRHARTRTLSARARCG